MWAPSLAKPSQAKLTKDSEPAGLPRGMPAAPPLSSEQRPRASGLKACREACVQSLGWTVQGFVHTVFSLAFKGDSHRDWAGLSTGGHGWVHDARRSEPRTWYPSSLPVAFARAFCILRRMFRSLERAAQLLQHHVTTHDVKLVDNWWRVQNPTDVGQMG